MAPTKPGARGLMESSSLSSMNALAASLYGGFSSTTRSERMVEAMMGLDCLRLGESK